MSNVTITVCDIDGKVISEEKTHNLVVASGRNIIRDKLNNSTAAGLTHFAVGTSMTAVTSTQTSLPGHVFIDTITQFVPSTAALSIKYFLGTADANGSTLTEAGVFNSSSNITNSLLHFDGTAGSTTITDNYGNTWTNFGTAVLSTAQIKFGTASLTLPGSADSYVETTDITNLGLGDWTQEGWFYISSTIGNFKTITGSKNIGFALRYNIFNGKLGLWLANSTTTYDIANSLSGTMTITSSAWHHWAITYNSSSYKVWVDGILDNTVTSTLLVTTNLGGIRLGLDPSTGPASAWNGFLDDYMLTKGIARYTEAFIPSTDAFTGGATTGTMYARVTHAGIAKSSINTITYNWDLSWSVI